MRNVTVNPDTKTLTIQGGAQWSDVDDKAWENGNLATVGGTVADTGVGGLTLGGGYGWLSGRHGLVIDNLISCEMVLADGSIVRSSKESNPDLFWALRGAGQNFGVATEFVIQAWTQQPVWAGLLGFTTDKLAQVLDVLNAVVLATEGQGAVVMAFWRFPPDTSPPGPVAIMVGIVYDGSEADGLSAGFERLLHLDPFMNTLAMVPYNSVSRMLAIPQGKRVSMKGASFTLPLRYEFVQQTLNSYAQFTDEIPEAGFSLLTYEMMDPRIICSVGNTETGFANRGRHMNAMVGPFWESEQFDMKSRRWARDMAEMFKNEALRKRNEGEDVEENDEAAAVAKIYGNYDREFPRLPLYSCSAARRDLLYFVSNQNSHRIRREIPRHLRSQFRAPAATQGPL